MDAVGKTGVRERIGGERFEAYLLAPLRSRFLQLLHDKFKDAVQESVLTLCNSALNGVYGGDSQRLIGKRTVKISLWQHTGARHQGQLQVLAARFACKANCAIRIGNEASMLAHHGDRRVDSA